MTNRIITKSSPILIKKITSALPTNLFNKLTELNDINNSGLSSTNAFLKYDSASQKFTFVSVSSLGGGLDSAAINSLITAADTHDSAAVVGQIDSAYVRPLARAALVAGSNITYDSATGTISSTASGSGTVDSAAVNTLIAAADTHDSAAVLGQINTKFANNATFSKDLNVDSNLTVGGYIGGPAVFTIDPAAIGDSTGKVIILGDLQVDGTQTTINSTTVSISDKNIVLADSATSASQADGAGITINGASATLQYASTGDKWVFNKAPYYNANRILTTADDLHDSAAVVGQIDSSYVRPLARAALVAGSNITYDSATGVIASTSSGGTGTDSATVVSIADSRIGVASIGALSDVDLTGIASNRVLKWDGAKFVAAIDATSGGGSGIALSDLSATDAGGFGSFAYNNVSGVFTYTGADSAAIKTVTSIPYANLTGTPTILDSAAIAPIVDSGVTNNISGTANQVTVTTGSKTATIGLPTNVTIDSNLTVNGYIAGPASFTIDPAGVGDSTGKVIILGDLQVDGTTTTINSTIVSISDKNIVLADSATNASQADGAGITINGASATLQYASTGDKWVFNKAPYYSTNRILTTADDLHDSASIQGQIDSAVTIAFINSLSGTLDADTLGGNDSAYYLNYNNFTNKPTIPTVDSAAIRPFARAAITAGSNITYDSATGVIAAVIGDTHDSAAVQGQIDSSINNDIIGTSNEVEVNGTGGVATIGLPAAVQITTSLTVGGNAVLTTASDTHDSAAVLGQINATVNQSFINALDTHDSAAVQGQINTTIAATDTHDSAAVQGQIDSAGASFLSSVSDDTMSANLAVTGTITTGTGSNTTVVDATDTNQYSIKHTLVGTSVTTGNATQISTFAHSSAAAAVEYVMQLQEATTNKTQVTKVLATYDGSEVAFTEYGVVHTGDSDLGTFAVSIDGSNIDLNFTRRGTNTVTVKIAKTIIV